VERSKLSAELGHYCSIVRVPKSVLMNSKDVWLELVMLVLEDGEEEERGD